MVRHFTKFLVNFVCFNSPANMICSKMILIMALVYTGPVTVSGGKFEWSSTQVSKRSTSFQKEELIVSTILNAPFLILKEGAESSVGEDIYEGYSVDLLKKLSKVANFNYTIKLVSDGKYGMYDEKEHQWSGMVGELLSRQADLIIADLVITSERVKVIDFTTPFMNTGITLLYKKEPYNFTKGLFTFIVSPFGVDIWLCVLAAYFTVSLVLYIIARFNASEKENAEESSSRTEDVVQSENGREAFTAINSFWFILASGLAQRVDFLLRAISTRLIAAFWWFFVIILISSYIAKLVVFLNFPSQTTGREKIETVQDLAEQTSIKYGTIQGDAVLEMTEQIDALQKMKAKIDKDK